MTARRTAQFALLALLVAGALTSTACASARTINELLADPDRYRNDKVRLSGEVIDSYSVGNRGIYQLDDGTGRLWIVSVHGVPRRTARVDVKGRVGAGLNLGLLGERWLPKALAAGMVLMASSHEAKK